MSATLLVAHLLLFFGTFSLTYKDAVWGKFARLAVAPILILATAKYEYEGRETVKTMYFKPVLISIRAAMTWNHIFKAIDMSLVSLYDESPPMLVSHETGQKEPLPKTLGGRFKYTLDQFFVCSGASFINGKHWDYSPFHVANYRSPFVSRKSFILSAVKRAMFHYILVDVGDTFVKRHLTFNLNSPNPILDLPPWVQCVTGVYTAVYLQSVLSIIEAILGIILVGSGLSTDLNNWPPLFNQTFLSPSISYFWSRGWHSIMRRRFERSSVPILALFGLQSLSKSRGQHKPGEGAALGHHFITVIFAFLTSAVLHSFMVRRIYEVSGGSVDRTSWTLFQLYTEFFFFAVQPLGIAVDRVFASRGNSSTIKFVRRIWVWTFMVWTSRWISDTFAKTYTWHGKEVFVPISVVRGFLYGDWTGHESVRVAFERLEMASKRFGS
ncbi:uncharacterized protein EI90DRAFT_3190151 [Cantharellus anzutake]|uniref:uncharacterized protein n=1 Tax=Cantharellus anzutake TaxID=1750568 RepID=UPI001906D93D|nr:uncharacterized protein EI90DRAFT_3190151 [Cantharellus anzutake]KAF8342657.1 hypothetical protein EI90DRAFT_3190151 [Cantharellus anzutake]